MEFRALFVEDDAVSSVLGVVLMVSVTIVLAAVIGTFVLGIGADLTDPSPDVSFDYRYEVNDDPAEQSELLVLHSGGERFDKFDVEITIGGETAYVGGQAAEGYSIDRRWPAQVRAGDRLELRDDGDRMRSGQTVRVYWSRGNQAAIIGETTLD